MRQTPTTRSTAASRPVRPLLAGVSLAGTAGLGSAATVAVTQVVGQGAANDTPLWRDTHRPPTR